MKKIRPENRLYLSSSLGGSLRGIRHICVPLSQGLVHRARFPWARRPGRSRCPIGRRSSDRPCRFPPRAEAGDVAGVRRRAGQSEAAACVGLWPRERRSATAPSRAVWHDARRDGRRRTPLGRRPRRALSASRKITSMAPRRGRDRRIPRTPYQAGYILNRGQIKAWTSASSKNSRTSIISDKSKLPPELFHNSMSKISGPSILESTPVDESKTIGAASTKKRIIDFATGLALHLQRLDDASLVFSVKIAPRPGSLLDTFMFSRLAKT